jgi:flagellar biosynthesis chaperone FliJ
LDHLVKKGEVLEKERVEASAYLEDERVKLTAVWRDLEVLKKLKQRQKEAWDVEQRRKETREIDEIGQLRADRARRENLSRVREQDSQRP